ncbi:hypothetical protein BD414DRAFT_446868 [Trametes punicea]|nr:hypothetical protein BD414DRAFT_446868 [Trametes punicea]
MPLHNVLRQRMQPLTAAVTSNRIFLYSIFSTFAVAATIANACRAHSNFYSVAIYLSKSSRSVLILANFGFLCALLCGRVFQRIFFGSLQPREVERLYDQTWMFVTESLLAFTIFRDEFDVPFLLMFGFLLFVKCFHWLMADRVESMDQTPYPGPPTLFHVRVNALFVVLWAIDTTMFAFAVESTLANGVGGMVLFASEYAILLASALNAMLRYGLSILDLRRARSRGGENAPPWENKSMYIFYIELLTDFLKLTTYMTFFMIILTFYGLPLNIIRDVFVTARSFITRLRALIRYHNATRDMDRRYPDATEAELAEMSDRTCIICREEMQSRNIAAQPEQAANGDQQQQQIPPADGPNMTPKKLPCGHIFHFQCLRSWLERQQSCPTCRRTVLDNNAPQTARQAPGQDQQGVQPPAPRAVPAPGNPQGQPGAGVAGNGPLGWVGRFFGVPPPPALGGQFQGVQGQFPQGAPPPAFQQQVVPNAAWGGPVPGQPPQLPLPAFYDPIAGWQHHPIPGQPIPPPPPMQQPPVFRGFYGPGLVWQPWDDPEAFDRQAPDPAQPAPATESEQPARMTLPLQAEAQQVPSAPGPTSTTDDGQRGRSITRAGGLEEPLRPPVARVMSSSVSTPERIAVEGHSVEARRAAAMAALRRVNQSAGLPASSSSQAAESFSSASLTVAAATPLAASDAAEEQPASAQLTATSSASVASASAPFAGPATALRSGQTAGQQPLPPLIPLYDTSIVRPTRVAGNNPYHAPYSQFNGLPGVRHGGHQSSSSQHSSATGPTSQSQTPRSARARPGGSRTPLNQLPPALTDEQLARLDRLTREAIDERLRVLEGVSGAIYRCMEELYRVRSVLPHAGSGRGSQPQPASQFTGSTTSESDPRAGPHLNIPATSPTDLNQGGHSNLQSSAGLNSVVELRSSPKLESGRTASSRSPSVLVPSADINSEPQESIGTHDRLSESGFTSPSETRSTTSEAAETRHPLDQVALDEDGSVPRSQ